MIRAVIFDFDGTIADTHDALFEIANSLSAEFGYKPVNQAKLSQLKNLSSRELVKQSEISLLKIPFFLKRIKSELGKKINYLSPVLGMKKCLFDLKSHGYQLGIITSNNQKNVTGFLKNNQLEELFDFIYSGTTLFGKDKVINNFVKQNYLKAEQVIYVGDETRDIEAAKKSGVKVVAVGWGFNSISILAKHQPDFLINHPQELIEVIKCISEEDTFIESAYARG